MERFGKHPRIGPYNELLELPHACVTTDPKNTPKQEAFRSPDTLAEVAQKNSASATAKTHAPYADITPSSSRA